ncbi:hypothetical protein PSHT_06527 [Puccinia striiformis]|uniref:Uncharacterized protein n=1 Tax=Puccinia striiformis TaxID=27350 RepID=A0A2S4W615_9BASI|nr:hypothetical protein PSHT_06527 [Puccinia striiformis]
MGCVEFKINSPIDCKGSRIAIHQLQPLQELHSAPYQSYAIDCNGLIALITLAAILLIITDRRINQGIHHPTDRNRSITLITLAAILSIITDWRINQGIHHPIDRNRSITLITLAAILSIITDRRINRGIHHPIDHSLCPSSHPIDCNGSDN